MTDLDTMAQGAQRPPAADYPGLPDVKWSQPGEYVYAQVTNVRTANTQNGQRTVCELNDQQRGPCQLWCSQVQLKSGLVDGNNRLGRAVQAGDILFVRYDGEQAIDGGKTVKNFAVNVAVGQPQAHQQPAQAQPPAQPAQQPQAAPQQPQQPAQPPQQPQPAPAQQQWPQQPAPPQEPGDGTNVPF